MRRRRRKKKGEDPKEQRWKALNTEAHKETVLLRDLLSRRSLGSPRCLPEKAVRTEQPSQQSANPSPANSSQARRHKHRWTSICTYSHACAVYTMPRQWTCAHIQKVPMMHMQALMYTHCAFKSSMKCIEADWKNWG